MTKKIYLKYMLVCISLLFAILIPGCDFAVKTNISLENNMVTHFIDVGQGDCILVQVNNKNLLIDSGTSDSKEKVIRYLKNNDIKKLHYIIATHPHDDHIGGMASVVKNFEVGEFYAPKVTSSTLAFQDMITALKNKNLKINISKFGVFLDLGPNTSCTILTPNKSSYKDINNYSSAIKISYKNSTYLFTGDIETLSEQELLNKNYDLSCDVLKVPHHGSNSSTSKDFLEKVYPKIAVISCGINNSYGHPSKETTDKLKGINCITYRTDLNGTVVLVSDGTKIKRLEKS
jgi:competence protein ComEC